MIVIPKIIENNDQRHLLRDAITITLNMKDINCISKKLFSKINKNPKQININTETKFHNIETKFDFFQERSHNG